MNTDIFRKVSLARLSSPDQLDQILRVTTPKNWIALTGIGLLLSVAVGWGYLGSVPTKASGQGVIVRSGGVLNVVSPAAGILLSMPVKIGDRIKPDQVIAKVEQPDILEKLKASENALQDLRGQRARALKARTEGARLDVKALSEQKSSIQQEIAGLKDQEKLAAERVPVEEDLLDKGLITKQEVIAARQKLLEIQGKIATDQANLVKIESQQFNANAQPLQNDEEMLAKISDMQRTIVVQKRELELATDVVSPYGGQVIELKADTGGVVTQGGAVLSVQPEVETLEALVYLPANKAKGAKLNQEAQISPSTIKREEFGFIKAKVVYVADYPATPAALMRNFQNDSLVKSLTAAGPVTELRVVLERDPSSPSGFLWSSSHGPDITISSGTICTVDVVTREQKPYTLILPFFKEKLGLS
jgi:HlyD family secretion protein